MTVPGQDEDKRCRSVWLAVAVADADGTFGLFDARFDQNLPPQVVPVFARGRAITSIWRCISGLASAHWGQQAHQGQSNACLCYVPIVSGSLCYVLPSLAGVRGFGQVAGGLLQFVIVNVSIPWRVFGDSDKINGDRDRGRKAGFQYPGGCSGIRTLQHWGTDWYHTFGFNTLAGVRGFGPLSATVC